MTREEKMKFPKTFVEKSTGVVWKTNGVFFTETRDWNFDNDIYTDTVMRIYQLDGENYRDIHRYDLIDYEEVNDGKFI